MAEKKGYVATSKFLIASPTKVRPVARVINQKPCTVAMAILANMPQKGAGLISATLKSAIANALNATTDQLLAHEFSHPEEIYLKEIAERIEKYPVSKRILACEGFNTYLDSLEKFSKS